MAMKGASARDRLALALAGAGCTAIVFELALLLQAYSKRGEVLPLMVGVVAQLVVTVAWLGFPFKRRYIFAFGVAELALAIAWLVIAPQASGPPTAPEFLGRVGYGQYELYGLTLAGLSMILAALVHSTTGPTGE